MQLRFKPSDDWIAPLYFRVGGSLVAAAPDSAWTAWTRARWRLFRTVRYAPDRWHQFTMRIDPVRGTYSSWIDGEVLGEGLPLSDEFGAERLFLGAAGSEADPMLFDDLLITRTPPEGIEERDLLPKPKPDLAFRFAALGDPQLGRGEYEADLARFDLAVTQIQQSDAAFTLVTGDMVNEADQEAAYRDVRAVLDRLSATPPHDAWYTVRGNHDRRDFYRQYFRDKLDYTFVYGDVRFIMLDAVGRLDVDPPNGTYQGLSEQQLFWLERVLGATEQAHQEVILMTHVSPWQSNPRGAYPNYRIGAGRSDLIDLLNRYNVTLVLSGHYHRGLWHHLGTDAAEGHGVSYVVLGGTSRVKDSALGWAVVDVYPDRLEVHHKPLFSAYDAEDVTEFYDAADGRWVSFSEKRRRYPYLVQGPLVIPRRGGAAVSVADQPAASGFSLEPNYPNPVYSDTQISFTLPAPSDVSLVVYNLLGQEVARLAEGPLPSGTHRVRWAPQSMPNGVYLYRLTADAYAASHRMVLAQ